MDFGEGKPFFAIIVGRILTRDEDGYVMVETCPVNMELVKRIKELGGKIIFGGGCNMLFELPFHVVSVASKLFLAVSHGGIFMVIAIDLLYPFRADTFISDSSEVVSRVKKLIEKLYPNKDIEIIDTQFYNYPISMIELAQLYKY
ncbi:MAG: hypothetical protein ACTSUJ_02535 [Candidatus Njordarchaeales archaeon]